MQGGLTGADGAGGQMAATTTGTDTGGSAPAATGSPAVGEGTGVTTSTDVGEMNAVERLLAGTRYTRDDVDLALNVVSTLVLLYWVSTEV
jgi:hypothetical protein